MQPELIHEFNEEFLLMYSVGWDNYLILTLRIQRLKNYIGVYEVVVSSLNLETRCSILAALLVQR